MVGLGNTKQKIETIVDSAEKTYTKLTELREQVERLQDNVEETSQQVDDLDRELAEQRALLEALADQQNIDVEQVLTEAAIDEPED